MSHGHTSDCFHLTGRAHGQDRKAPELSTVTVSGVVGVAGVAKARDSPTKTIKRWHNSLTLICSQFAPKSILLQTSNSNIAFRRRFRMELHTKFLTI
jgi:hypothetical protein